MITEQEQEKLRFLSDTELYPQAVQLMRSIARELPQKQTNGLLNVSLANTYKELQRFVNYQHDRKTWPAKEQHIPAFYRVLGPRLEGIAKKYVPSIMKARAEQPSPEDVQTLKILLAREFIQHVLAENAYMGAIKAFQSLDRDNARDQGRPQGNYRGPAPRQGRI